MPRTAVFLGPERDLDIREYSLGQAPAGQASLSLVRSGICGTDVHIMAGKLPQASPIGIGHEFMGRIEALGDTDSVDGLGQRLAVGDTAIACVAAPCGACRSCRRGESANCLQMGVTYKHDPDQAPHFVGGYSEALVTATKQLVRVPEGLDADAVVAFACAGPTSIHAFNRAPEIEPGSLVVVQGSGPVGLFSVAWAAKAGATVVMVGSTSLPDRERLARAFGATEYYDFRRVTPAERVERIQALAAATTGGDGADMVIEASGAPEGFVEGLQLVGTLGCFLVPGQYSLRGEVSIPPQLITFKALRVIGSSQYQLADIGTYLDFLVANPDLHGDFAACVSGYGLGAANQALTDAAAGGIIKGAFRAN